MPGQIEIPYSGNFIVLIFDSLFCLIHTKRKEYRHDYIQKPIVILFFQNSSGATILMCGCINSLNIHFNKAK
jgi:hypothetical protein